MIDNNEPFEPEKLQDKLALIEEARKYLIVKHGDEPECPSWESITPSQIRIAIGAIRKEVFMIHFQYRGEIAGKCRNALRSFTPTAALPLPFLKAHQAIDAREYWSEITKYREQRIEPEAATTLSEIFKAYCDKYTDAAWKLMRGAFTKFLGIARTQQHLIGISATDWANAHTSIVLRGEHRELKGLITEMCDTQELDSSTEIDEDYMLWRSWRAPLLVHMLPMGNTPYDYAHAWDREDKETTEKTLEGVSRHVLMGVVFGIERIVNELHVEAALSAPFPHKPGAATKAWAASTAGALYSFKELEQKFKECRVGRPGSGFPHAWVLSDGSTRISALGTRIGDYCALAGRAMGYAGDDPQVYWVRHVAGRESVHKKKFTTRGMDEGTRTAFVIEDLAEASAHVCRLLMLHEGNKAAPLNAELPIKDRLYIEEIDSFQRVRDVNPALVTTFLDNGYLKKSEDQVQLGLEQILGVSFHKKDSSVELNDLFTANVVVNGTRRATAFLLKGPGIGRKEMTIADCGRNGDQIVKLFDTPADLFVVQYVGPISDLVIKDVQGKTAQLRSAGKTAHFLIMDGQDTARVLNAYGKI